MVNSEEEVEFCEELFDAEISRIVGILRSSMMSTVLEAWLKSRMGESHMFRPCKWEVSLQLLFEMAFPLVRIEWLEEAQDTSHRIEQKAFFLPPSFLSYFAAESPR